MHLDCTTKAASPCVDPGMFEPFMQLVARDNDNVRLIMAESTSRLFSHIKISHANGKLNFDISIYLLPGFISCMEQFPVSHLPAEHIAPNEWK